MSSINLHAVETTVVLQTIKCEPHRYLRRAAKQLALGVSDKVRHKTGTSATVDGLRLDTSDLGSRGIVLSS